MYTMPLYEVRYHDKEDWEDISDVELMDRLYKVYYRVSPVIKEMIKGKEVQTPEAAYRLKLKGGEQLQMSTV